MEGKREMTEEELLLEDRLAVIRAANGKYDLESNAYLSFSGGKDSTVLHHLLDMALPGNRIPRVFLNTGIEYQAIRDFVMKTAQNDTRFTIISSAKPIKAILETYGYPFKSKEHSMRVDQFNKGTNANYIVKYINGYSKDGKPSRFVCPKSLLYQFEKRGMYHYSNLCCQKLKKETAHAWEKRNGRKIAITGMRSEEGGNRKRLGCIISDARGGIKRFHPLIKVSEEWEDWLILENGIELCELYYPPFNFKRTGCKGCPFALDLQEQLSIMEVYLPNERRQCEAIWKPVYDEYRRIGYRLKKDEQLKLL